MKNLNLGQIIQIAANVGVIAGIVFLVVELQQNNELLEAQTLAERFDRSSGFAEEIVRNPALAAVIDKVERNEEITGADDVLLRALALRVFRQLEWLYREGTAGRLDLAPTLAIYQQGFKGEGIFRWPLGQYWADMDEFFAPDFVQFVEENIVNQ